MEIDKDYFLTESTAPVSALLTPGQFFGAPGTTAYLNAQQNNIGCLIQPGITYVYAGLGTPVQQATSLNGVSIIIPAAFNGNLRVTLTVTGTGLTACTNPDYTGNVVAIRDLYGALAPAIPFTNGSSVASVSANQIVYVCDVYVKQASAIAYNAATAVYTGGNNIISFPLVAGLTVVGSTIQIEQYQALGGLSSLTSNDQRISWVNRAGTLVIP